MEATVPPSVGKKLWHMLRVMYYMLRRGFSKHKLMVDFHLLRQRGKIAGKALGNFLHHHNHHGSSATAAAASSGFHYSGFSCRSMDPNTSFYNPREVEFSFSNTPNFPATKRKNRHHYKCDAAAIAKAFEILNSEAATTEPAATADTPSPCPVFNFGKSPVGVRQLRITDSPFPIKEGPPDGQVDKEAEEFIRRFYEQLSLQQRITDTPEYRRYCREPLAGRA